MTFRWRSSGCGRVSATAVSALEDFQEEAVARLQAGEDGIPHRDRAARDSKYCGPRDFPRRDRGDFVAKSRRLQAAKAYRTWTEAGDDDDESEDDPEDEDGPEDEDDL